MENFTKIPNTILELMVTGALTDREKRVLAFIVRKTYGFNKEWDQISLSQFEKATGLQRSHINSTLNTLVSKRLLGKKVGDAKTSSSWRILDPSLAELLVTKNTLVVKKVVSESLPTKESYTKYKLKVEDKPLPQAVKTNASEKEKLEYWNSNVDEVIKAHHLQIAVEDLSSAREAYIQDAFSFSRKSILGFLRNVNRFNKNTQKGEFDGIKSL